jgi:L-galactose dehydrogenase
VIGFGASPFGNVFGDVPPKHDERIVREAVDAGINIFDVSPYYGLGLAEERLGAALGPWRDSVLLTTKAGRYDAENFDFSARTVTRSLDASLRRLQTDHVDLFQVYDIEFGSIDQILQETLPAAAELKHQGKTRFIGITSYWPDLLSRIATEFPVDTILSYCHANLFVGDMDRVLSGFAKKTATGLINASPLHMGLLGGGPVPLWHPAPPAVRAAAKDVNQLCRNQSVDPATLAIYLCLQHPVVATTFVGISTAEQVSAACAALEWQPDVELLNAVRARVDPVFNTVWPQGRPENADQSLAVQDASMRNGVSA